MLLLLLISPFSFSNAVTQRAFAIGKCLSKHMEVSLLVTGTSFKKYFLDSIEIIEFPFLLDRRERNNWARITSWVSSLPFKLLYSLSRYETFYTFKTLPLANICGLVNKKIKKIQWISDWDDWEGKEGLGQFDPPIIRDFLDVYEKRILEKPDSITCCSKFMEKTLEKIRNKDEIFYIPNAIFLEDFESIEKISIHHPSIFFGGSLGKVSELEIIIESISMVKEGFPDLKFLVAGVGEKMNSYKQLVNRLKIRKNVVFLGKIPKSKVNSYVKYSDISVIPMKLNIQNLARCPVKISEYMACGGCIVSNPVGEAKGFLKNSGVLIGYSPEEFSEAFYKLLSDSKLRQKIKKKALKDVKKFEWKKITKKFVSQFI